METGRLPVCSGFGTAAPTPINVYLGAREIMDKSSCHGPYLDLSFRVRVLFVIFLGGVILLFEIESVSREIPFI